METINITDAAREAERQIWATTTREEKLHIIQLAIDASAAQLREDNKRLRVCVLEQWDGVAADKILSDNEPLRTRAESAEKERDEAQSTCRMVIQRHAERTQQLNAATEELATLRAKVDAQTRALEEAERTFLNYAAMHEAKQPPATQKAESNRQAAQRCRAALNQPESEVKPCATKTELAREVKP